MVEQYLDGIITDLGGREVITEMELHTAEIAQTARGVQMLILRQGQRDGITRQVEAGGWDLMIGFKDLARFQSIELMALRTLGLERKARVIVET